MPCYFIDLDPSPTCGDAVSHFLGWVAWSVPAVCFVGEVLAAVMGDQPFLFGEGCLLVVGTKNDNGDRLGASGKYQAYRVRTVRRFACLCSVLVLIHSLSFALTHVENFSGFVSEFVYVKHARILGAVHS